MVFLGCYFLSRAMALPGREATSGPRGFLKFRISQAHVRVQKAQLYEFAGVQLLEEFVALEPGIVA